MAIFDKTVLKNRKNDTSLSDKIPGITVSPVNFGDTRIDIPLEELDAMNASLVEKSETIEKLENENIRLKEMLHKAYKELGMKYKEES